MKIAISSTGPTLEDTVESRFGRCEFFLIVDPDTMDAESIPNPNISLGGGAGIQSAQLLANKGVSVVLTGNCGPNAFQTFGAGGIQVITGVQGTIRAAVEQYKAGGMANAAGPNVESHFGMGSMAGSGQGMGMGRGGGRGMGRGGGRGMGRRMMQNYQTSQGAAQPVDGKTSNRISAENELPLLKDHVKALKQQLEDTESRINELERAND